MQRAAAAAQLFGNAVNVSEALHQTTLIRNDQNIAEFAKR